MWYAAADRADRSHDRAREVLSGGDRLITTDHVLVETWLLLRWRLHREAAERFWSALESGVSALESVKAGDLAVARRIGDAFADQDFSIVDRTSFAVMQRLGVVRAASLDDDFAVYRFGRDRRQAFEVVR